MYAKIVGTGSYLPERIMSNEELAATVDTSDEWITERTGIRQRHLAADGQTTSDLATMAARQAVAAAGITANDIDLIIIATTTPDLVFPSTACLVQAKLDITNGCPAFDVQAVCSGFVYAMSIADNFIRAGQARCALVIGAETLSRITDWTDRSNCILWGDGAGAVILTATETPGIIATHLHADGRHKNLLCVNGGVSAGVDGAYKMQMEGNAVFRVAVKTLDAIVDETLAANGLQKSDVTWLVPHQANIRIIQATAKKLGMSMDNVVVTVDKHANTSAASVPLALDTAVRDGRIKTGDIVLMEAFGGGFTWGSVLVKWA
ncbi:MAG: ketoacyl-ACP synthase III [Sulfuriferula sp.]|nr:ketoacyl-ACP synthase III [Sulfuriferula sp.]